MRSHGTANVRLRKKRPLIAATSRTALFNNRMGSLAQALCSLQGLLASEVLTEQQVKDLADKLHAETMGSGCSAMAPLSGT